MVQLSDFQILTFSTRVIISLFLLGRVFFRLKKKKMALIPITQIVKQVNQESKMLVPHQLPAREETSLPT